MKARKVKFMAKMQSKSLMRRLMHDVCAVLKNRTYTIEQFILTFTLMEYLPGILMIRFLE